MFTKTKKYIYYLLTRQRRSAFGKFLYSFCERVIEALENKNNDFETNGEKWLIESLKFNDKLTVFDVGANVGNWAKLVHNSNQSVMIHSFEPVPVVFKKLVENTKDISQIKSNNLALGASLGILKMNYYPENTLFSSFYEHPLGKSKNVPIEVDIITGDDYCHINGIKFIDFLKIDVEGYESNVLFGFEKMIKTNSIRMIQFEYGDLSLKSGFILKNLYDFFYANDYSVGKLFPDYVEFGPYNYKKENFLTSNFIALKNGEKL